MWLLRAVIIFQKAAESCPNEININVSLYVLRIKITPLAARDNSCKSRKKKLP